MYVAKNGRKWTDECINLQGRFDVIRKAPGPTRLAKSGLDFVETAFDLFLTTRVVRVLQDLSNQEGNRLFGDN